MFDLNDQSPQGNLVRMLQFTAAIMIFLGASRLIRAGGLPDFDVFINSPEFMNVFFGGCSYLGAYLIQRRNNLAYIPIAAGALYPLSVSLTTGLPLNIVLILFGAYILYRIWRLHQASYFE